VNIVILYLQKTLTGYYCGIGGFKFTRNIYSLQLYLRSRVGKGTETERRTWRRWSGDTGSWSCCHTAEHHMDIVDTRLLPQQLLLLLLLRRFSVVGSISVFVLV